jgi:hypothetical protein
MMSLTEIYPPNRLSAEVNIPDVTMYNIRKLIGSDQGQLFFQDTGPAFFSGWQPVSIDRLIMMPGLFAS